MKKLIALTMVCGFALAFVACGGGSTTTNEENTESADTAMTAPMDADTTSTDTTATDTTAAQ